MVGIRYLADVLFGDKKGQATAIKRTALNLSHFQLSFMLAVRPELSAVLKNDSGRGTLAWVNTFAGLHGKAGEETLLVLHNRGIDVISGLNLAVAYNAQEYGGAKSLQRFLATDAIDQNTKDRALGSAVKAGQFDNAVVLRQSGAVPKSAM